MWKKNGKIYADQFCPKLLVKKILRSTKSFGYEING